MANLREANGIQDTARLNPLLMLFQHPNSWRENMGLGEQLREAMEKLRKSTFADQETIKEAVKQMQRALISADVEIGLVLQISKRIEKAAFSELPPGLNRREHVLKETHDALAELLGGKENAPPENPERILLVGLFGSGKCVHPATIVPTANGNIQTIEEIYNQENTPEFQLEDGFVKELPKPFEVFSLNPSDLKITRGKATHLWKLRKDKPLYKICADNGNNHQIIVTPEHPFFVIENGQVQKIKAEELTVGKMIATPRTIPLPEENQPIDYFDGRLEPAIQLADQKVSEDAKQFMQQQFGTLQNAFNCLQEPYAYCTFTANLKRGIIRLSTLYKLQQKGFMPATNGTIVLKKSKCKARKTKLPTSISPELTEFLGYFLADGHMRKQYIEITNEDNEILNRVKWLGKELFEVKGSLKADKRNPNVKKIVFCSTVLTTVFHQIFSVPLNKKSAIIRIPPQLLRAERGAKKTFLQAYFDCDGHIAKNTRQIEFCTASQFFAEDLGTLLSSLGLVPSKSRKIINNTPYYRLCLKAKDAEWFAQEVGSRIAFKQQRLKNCAAIGEGQTFGKQELIATGSKTKEVREYYGATIGEIQKHVSSYGTYESEGLISRNALQKFIAALQKTKNKNNEILERCLAQKDTRELCKELSEHRGWTNASVYRLKELELVEYSPNGTIQTTEKGRQLLQKNRLSNQELLSQLQILAHTDIAWIRIKKIELVDNTEFVYDLTVEEYHNFVANQIIVHNTTTCGKLAKYYSKRGKKVGVIAADAFRPAAFEQLQQIGKKISVPVFGNPAEKNAGKIVEQALKEAKGFDLLVCDSAGRNALDAELQKEIKEIHRAFKPEFSWLVLGADMGQLAAKQSKAFHELIGVNGVIITRLDGSAKGGGALAACHHTQSPVFFVGTGEKTNDLEAFDATRYLSRIMGYGDLQGLLEKAQEASEETEINLEELASGEFTMETFYKQLEATKKIGPLDKVMEMMGMKQQLPKEALELGQEKLEKFKFMMDSMTQKEKQNPDVLNNSRIARIGKGSGTTQEEVRSMLKQFKRMQKAFKQLKGIKEQDLQSGKGMEKLQKMFAKKKKFKVR